MNEPWLDTRAAGLVREMIAAIKERDVKISFKRQIGLYQFSAFPV